MKNTFIIILLFLSMCLWAQIPQTIDYQGRLADSDGNYLNSVVTVDFLIYDAETGGTALWSETQDVSTANGIFHVQLGSLAAFPGTLFDGADRWLELIVSGETLSPRTAIAAVPYSLKAEDADLLGGLNSSNFALSAHNHSASNITSGTLDTGRYSAYSDLFAEGYLNNNSTIDLLTRDQGDTRWVNITGDTMTGTLTVPSINYSSPRVHYEIVGEAEFMSRDGSSEIHVGLGSGGAYLLESNSAFGMIAHADVPVNATITDIDIGYYDNDTVYGLIIYVWRHSVLGSGYSLIGSVETYEVSPGYNSIALGSGLPATLSNPFELEIVVIAFNQNTGIVHSWPGSSLKVTGVRVTYEINEAP